METIRINIKTIAGNKVSNAHESSHSNKCEEILSMDLEIIYENDTELAEFEAFNRGYREDVIVIINNKKYKVYIISMVRLQQDFEKELQDSGYYMAEPNMILVNDVTKKEIEYTIMEMYKCKFFERLDNCGF